MQRVDYSPVINKYKTLLSRIKNTSDLEFEVSLFINPSLYKVVSIKDGIMQLHTKEGAKIFNALEPTKLYSVVLLKNAVEISLKENTSDFSSLRRKKISSLLLPRIESEIKILFVDLETLKKKNKSKLSDEDKHELKSLTSAFEQANKAVQSLIADFSK